MKQETQTQDFSSGFVAVIGRPNVGKSTLVNKLLGTKISIVSPKPQTTRTRIHGILNLPGAQLILVDTPGFCRDRGPLTRALRHTAGSAAADADLSLVIAEIYEDEHKSPSISDADREVLQAARQGPGKVVLAINKVDQLERKESLLPWMAAYAQEYDLAAVLPISARTGDGLDTLVDELTSRLPQGPALFPVDMHTDQAERFICAELVREQLLYQTQDEVPHSAVVTIESFEDGRDDGSPRPMCHLEGRIYVDRESQKAIVIGKGGHQIKSLGQEARQRIEQLLGCKVFLKLTVHVDKHWTTNERALVNYGISASLQAETRS